MIISIAHAKCDGKEYLVASVTDKYCKSVHLYCFNFRF